MPTPITWPVGGSPPPNFDRSAMAQPYTLTGPYTCTVKDDASVGGRTVTFNPGGTPLAYRTFLAKQVGAAGTKSDPVELLADVAAQLNLAAGGTLWGVVMQSTGLVRLQYLGMSVNGEIHWTSSSAVTIRNQLGHTADVVLAPGGAAYVDAAYLPNHFVLAGYLANDAGWHARMPRFAGSRTDYGVAYGTSNGAPGMRRKFDLAGHPIDAATRASLGMYSTPAFDDRANWAALNNAVGLTPTGWSVRQFMDSAPGQRLGVALGTFQALVSGAQLDFDDANLSVEASQGEDRTLAFIRGYAGKYTWRDVELEWLAKSTR